MDCINMPCTCGATFCGIVGGWGGEREGWKDGEQVGGWGGEREGWKDGEQEGGRGE